MKITVTGSRFCVRAMKQLVSLRVLKQDATLFSPLGAVVQEEFLPFIGPVSYCINWVTGLDAADTDVLHLHCEPFPKVQELDMLPRPAVLDVHDLDTIRTGEVCENEAAALRHPNVVGVLFPGPSYERRARELIDFDAPSEWVPSAVPRAFIVDQPRPYLGGIAYQGALSVPWETGVFAYADYTRAVTESEEQFYLYSSNYRESHMNWYQNLGAVYRPKQTYFELLAELSRHEYGWCKAGAPCDQWRYALTNKFFEYLAAGIEPLVGESIDSLELLALVSGRTRPDFIEAANDLAMERFVEGRLLPFYEKVAG